MKKIDKFRVEWNLAYSINLGIHVIFPDED
jgi:hypothetical protein